MSNPLPWIIGGTALASTIGGFLGGGGQEGLDEGTQRWLADFQWKQSLRNEQFQHDLAEKGIRMRVADAEAAGLHPLAALGASPSGGGSFSSAFGGNPSYKRSIGDGLQNMGQNIDRAVMAMTTPEEKQMKQLQLQKMRTENEILNTELTERRNNLMRTSAVGLPSNSGLGGGLTGQGNAYVMEQPLRSTHRQPGAAHQDVGHIADMAFARTAGGGLAVVPSKDVKERIEDQLIPEFAWAMRNYGSPNFGNAPKPNPKYYPLPRGFTHWRWNPLYQEYRPARSDKPWYNRKYEPWKKSWWTYEGD